MLKHACACFFFPSKTEKEYEMVWGCLEGVGEGEEIRLKETVYIFLKRVLKRTTVKCSHSEHR